MDNQNELKDSQLLDVVGGEGEETLPDCYTEDRENKRGSGVCGRCPHASTCKNLKKDKIIYPEQREVN